MKNKILKRAFALGCLTLALFCVVKKEEDGKKPIIMKQMTVAEEVIERDGQEDLLDNQLVWIDDEVEKIEEDIEVEEEPDVAVTERADVPEMAERRIAEEVETIAIETETVEYQSSDDLSIMVMGSATTSVAPDSGVIYARIEMRDGDCASAKESALTAFNNVVSALTESGIDENAIRMEHFNCSTCYEFSMTKSITGYCATLGLSVDVDNLDNLQQYISLLTENGACCIDNICYKVADMQSQYNDTLAKAIENARIKAEKMSGQEGLTLVKIKEEMMHSSSLLKACSNEATLADYIGNIDIEARVVAIFEK